MAIQQMQCVFLEDIHAQVAVVKSVCLHWVSDFGLKTQNE